MTKLKEPAIRASSTGDAWQVTVASRLAKYDENKEVKPGCESFSNWLSKCFEKVGASLLVRPRRRDAAQP